MATTFSANAVTGGATGVAVNSQPEIWAKKVAAAVEFECLIAGRVTRDYEGEVARMGDTVNVMTVSNFTANTKSVATDIVFEAITNTNNAIVIDTQKYTAVLMEDLAVRQAVPGFVERQTKKLAYPLSRAMDVSLSAIFDGFADNGTIGTLGVELLESDYMAAWQKLAEAGAIMNNQMNEDVSWILSPAAYVAALKIDRLVSNDFDVQGSLAKAGIKAILGAPVFMSNLLESDASGQHDCALFHKDVLALVCQQEPHVESQRVIQAIADAFVASVIYGVKEIDRPAEAAACATNGDAFGVYVATI